MVISSQSPKKEFRPLLLVHISSNTPSSVQARIKASFSNSHKNVALTKTLQHPKTYCQCHSTNSANNVSAIRTIQSNIDRSNTSTENPNPTTTTKRELQQFQFHSYRNRHSQFHPLLAGNHSPPNPRETPEQLSIERVPPSSLTKLGRPP
ncbi:hypothetical protein M758_1G161700 [Ceratodon purpureus]|nr:hypothetical protein M758_1G161700 [Ceratodon purpureus]